MSLRIQKGTLGMQFGLTCVASYGLFQAWNYEIWTAGQPGAGLYPFGICAALLVLLGISIVSDWRVRADGADTAPGDPPDRRRFMSYLLGLVIFAGLSDVLGYLATALLALIVMLHLGERIRFPKAVLLALIITSATWVVFVWVFSVPLATWPAAFRQ